jgi:hypothetical protein
LRAERLVRGNAAWGRVGNEIAPLDLDARTLDATLRNAVKSFRAMARFAARREGKASSGKLSSGQPLRPLECQLLALNVSAGRLASGSYQGHTGKQLLVVSLSQADPPYVRRSRRSGY